jgi:hypothetical protein
VPSISTSIVKHVLQASSSRSLGQAVPSSNIRAETDVNKSLGFNIERRSAGDEDSEATTKEVFSFGEDKPIPKRCWHVVLLVSENILKLTIQHLRYLL